MQSCVLSTHRPSLLAACCRRGSCSDEPLYQSKPLSTCRTLDAFVAEDQDHVLRVCHLKSMSMPLLLNRAARACGAVSQRDSLFMFPQKIESHLLSFRAGWSARCVEPVSEFYSLEVSAAHAKTSRSRSRSFWCVYLYNN